jgi:hypothetical protein
MFADALDGLVDRGYLAWKTYLLQAEPTEKGKKFTSENAAVLDNLPRVDDSIKWFETKPKKIVR